MEPDFAGYVTRYNVKCSDGATIKPGAFAHFDGKQVPLVFMHDHKNIENVLGHVALEDRPLGLYGRAFLNGTPNANLARQQVAHGDIDSFSIWANDLVGKGKDILHGALREVSLVLSGANKLAVIDWLNPSIAHDDFANFENEEAVICLSGDIMHGDHLGDEEGDDDVPDDTKKTVKEVLDTFNDEQKEAMAHVVAELLEGARVEGPADDESDAESDESQDDPDENESDEDTTDDSDVDAVEHDNLEGDHEMTRNVFEQNAGDDTSKKVLAHDAIQTILKDGKKLGSFREGVLAHAEDYGIQDIESLFPEVKDVYNPPEFIKRDTNWVNHVLSKVRKLPFSKIRTRFADIREDEARAKGYMKGNLKKEEVFTLLKRTTAPATIYKKQKLDRDDIIDITDFDVVAWIRAEMRLMLEEELARAILLGDGRPTDDEDKIKDPYGATDGVGIRSIVNDDPFYAERVTVTSPTTSTAQAFVDDIVRARRKWKGTGTPTFYTTVDVTSELLLSRDSLDRRYYNTLTELASAMLVDSVVEVEVMEEYSTVVGIMVNLADYSVGSTRGGELTSFDDFDIDYNQYKYLLETRLSGALTRWKAALVFVTEDFEVQQPVEPDGGDNGAGEGDGGSGE